MKKSNPDNSNFNRNYGNILGVKIAGNQLSGVLRFVTAKLTFFNTFEAKKSKFLIVTPNSEQLLMSAKDKVFNRILNSADIAICDGVGLAQAGMFLDLAAPKNIFRLPIVLAQGLCVGLATFVARDWLYSKYPVVKGRQLFLELIKLANKRRWRVMLVGNREGSAQRAQSELEKNYKRVKLYAADGPNMDNAARVKTVEDGQIEKSAINKINEVKPHLLIVGFGAPKQEKWIDKWISKLTIGGAMVVGGTFDYISGKTKLPPELFESVGLEWLWRLITKSQNVKRIINAVIIFPWRVFVYKLTRD